MEYTCNLQKIQLTTYYLEWLKTNRNESCSQLSIKRQPRILKSEESIYKTAIWINPYKTESKYW
jgi:hypothetical protein